MDGVATSELQESLFSADAMPYEIKLNDSGSDVESMQSRLNELGYYNGKINGYFGVATEDALESVPDKEQNRRRRCVQRFRPRFALFAGRASKDRPHPHAFAYAEGDKKTDRNKETGFNINA